MTYINNVSVKPKEVSKIVKAALAERFGRANVSVHQGSGTAYGWIDASVTIGSKPKDCFCEPRQPYCSRCREALNEAGKEGRDRVMLAMQKANAEFSHYYGDMDNEERNCFNLSVNFKRDE